MNAVFIMRMLALGDFEGIITEEISSRMSSYPEVQPGISPYQPHWKMERHFAIWGLFLAVTDMVKIDTHTYGTYGM